MTEIHLLTLDLFYYYLYKGFDVTDKKIAPFDSYWQKYQEKYQGENTEKDSSLILIHQDFQGKLSHIKDQLEDTNILFLNCSVKADKIVAPDIISQLKEQINPPTIKDNNVSLGYTWRIYGWGKCNDDTIKTLYKNLVGEEWNFQREGKFLGAKIVEAWRSSREWDVPELGTHVLIIFYHNKEDYEKASNSEITNAWLTLLWYRHKIWYSYTESRDSKDTILRAFNKNAPKDLKDYEKYNLSSLKKSLEKNLKTLTTYSFNLNNIGIHQHTLSTNSYNYTFAVRDFLKVANDACKINYLWTNDLKFLEEFSKITKIKYEKQLERDYATLAPGLAVLTGLTETIRGLVEVQQARIDRQQNRIIAIVGLGLATSGAVAGIVATQVYQPEQSKIEPSPKPQATPTTAEPTTQTTTQLNNPPPDWLLGRDQISVGMGFFYSLVIPVTIAFLAFLWYQRNHKSNK